METLEMKIDVDALVDVALQSIPAHLQKQMGETARQDVALRTLLAASCQVALMVTPSLESAWSRLSDEIGGVMAVVTAPQCQGTADDEWVKQFRLINRATHSLLDGIFRAWPQPEPTTHNTPPMHLGVVVNMMGSILTHIKDDAQRAALVRLIKGVLDHLPARVDPKGNFLTIPRGPTPGETMH